MMIEKYLNKRGVRLTDKGRNWAENAEAIGFWILLFIVFGIVGTIEIGGY